MAQSGDRLGRRGCDGARRRGGDSDGGDDAGIRVKCVQRGDCTPPEAAGTAPADTGDYPPLDMDGSLDGCWYTYVSDAKENPSGTYKETGTELFVGCLNGTTCGEFTTTCTFTGKFTSSLEEIHGRCQHPVTGTTGGFAGMSGVIQFADDVDTGIFIEATSRPSPSWEHQPGEPTETLGPISQGPAQPVNSARLAL